MPTKMSNNGFRTTAVRRAPATSWQEQQEFNARDAWDESGEWVNKDRQNADTNRNRYRGGADSAYDALNGYKPNETMNYNPSEMAGFDPGQFFKDGGGSSFDASQFSGGGRAGGYRSSALEGFDPSVGDFRSENLEGFSADDVSGFDPSAYGKEFAGGAYGEFKMGLDDELDALGNNAVGRGRMNTGFFDKDRGGVVTRLGGDFNNKIAQQSGVFSGQRLGALEAGARMRLDRASGIDANALTARTAADRMRLDRASGIDSNMLGAAESADRFNLEGGRLALSRDELGSRNASEAAGLSWDRAKSLDEMRYGRARDIDQDNFRTRSTALDASMGREGRYMDDYQRSADRTSDYVSGTRDWAAADREAQDKRDAARPRFGRMVARGPNRNSSSSQDPMRILAGQLGVPYKG